MALSTPMGPPGFSLRVKLFSPNSYGMNSEPTRLFRVITTPEATVGEFCEQVSRFHKANYGESITIKKCQDDEGFDITQRDIIGELFVNIATIRVIQAIVTHGVRDSIPPTSSLRYDPASHAGRKREREGSARPNGSPLSSTFRPYKRQKAADLDPDQPIPSLETGLYVGGIIDDEDETAELIIPNSQRQAMHRQNKASSHFVRDDRRISETPSVPPELPEIDLSENGSANSRSGKSIANDTDDIHMSQMSIPSPFGPASLRTQSSARSKSASYHISRATERGTSVSTAATSPLTCNQQGAVTNGTGNKFADPVPEALKTNGHHNSRSPNEDSIYEDIPSDSERSSVMRRTKDKLKPKNGSPSGHGQSHLNSMPKFITPPNGSRRTSRSQDRITANGELPLTPSSKERAEKQREDEQTNEAKIAIAKAAEQRATDDSERQRQTREQREHEVQEKRNAVIVKASRLEQERLEQMEQERELDAERKVEENRRERERIRKEEQLAKLERERRAALIQEQEEREQEARLELEEARAEEAAHARVEEAKNRTRTAFAVEIRSKSREVSEKSKSSTPDRSKATPIQPQASSTAFFPSGRKSALKTPALPAAGSSSPLLTRTVSAGSSVMSQAELLSPSETKRRVSFVDDNAKPTPREGREETFMAAPAKSAILPPPRNTAMKPFPNTASRLTPKLAAKTPIVPPLKKSTTPIPVPSSKYSRKERSTTPLVHPTMAPPQLGIIPRPTVTKVLPPTTKSITPPARSLSREISTGLAKSRELPKSYSAPRGPSSVPSDQQSEEEDEDQEEQQEEEKEESESDYSEDQDGVEDEDDKHSKGSSRIDPVQALNASLRSPSKLKIEVESELESASQDEVKDEDGDGDGDIMMRDSHSDRSSSRSPIHFKSHTTPKKSGSARSVESASSGSDTSADEDDSLDDDNSADSEEGSSDEDDDDEDKTITARAPPSPPPPLNNSKATIGAPSQIKPSQPSSAAIKKPSTPMSSGRAARPRFAIGASLSDMNARKPALGSSAVQANREPRPLKLTKDDDEESEEESEEEESDSDHDEPAPSQTLPKPIRPQSSTSNTSTSEESSDPDSSSSSDEEDDMKRHQNDLSAVLSKMLNESQSSTQSCDDVLSPKLFEGAHSSTSKGNLIGKGSFGKGTKQDKSRVFAFSRPV